MYSFNVFCDERTNDWAMWVRYQIDYNLNAQVYIIPYFSPNIDHLTPTIKWLNSMKINGFYYVEIKFNTGL